MNEDLTTEEARKRIVLSRIPTEALIVAVAKNRRWSASSRDAWLLSLRSVRELPEAW